MPTAKNLIGIPWRVALSLQDDGWILRNAIIWDKPNAMPASIKDRLSNRYEHVFLFAKSRWTGGERPRLADVDAAWLAALIDGAGCITIGCDKRSEKNPKDQDVYSILVTIANTSVPLLDKAARLIGAPIVRPKNVGASRPGYAVQVSGDQAAAIINAVMPWLIDKSPQAEIAAALHDTQSAARTPKAAHGSADGRAYKRRLWEAMRDANCGEAMDLSWLRKPRRGRYVPNPYWFDLDAIRLPYTTERAAALNWARNTKEADVPGQNHRQHRADRTPYPPGIKPQNGKAATGQRHTWEDRGGRNPGDVWVVPTQPFAEAHFAVMPLVVAQQCVQAGCRPGGTVLDPCSGAGTTGQAAQRTGRRYIGIDINADYLDLSLRTRLRDATLNFHENAAAAIQNVTHLSTPTPDDAPTLYATDEQGSDFGEAS